MSYYSFSFQSADGRDREDTGSIGLLDDDAKARGIGRCHNDWTGVSVILLDGSDPIAARMRGGARI